MVSAAWQGAEDGDVLLLLHDCARKKIDADTLSIIEILKKSMRVSLILNKTDLTQAGIWPAPESCHNYMISKSFHDFS